MSTKASGANIAVGVVGILAAITYGPALLAKLLPTAKAATPASAAPASVSTSSYPDGDGTSTSGINALLQSIAQLLKGASGSGGSKGGGGGSGMGGGGTAAAAQTASAAQSTEANLVSAVQANANAQAMADVTASQAQAADKIGDIPLVDTSTGATPGEVMSGPNMATGAYSESNGIYYDNTGASIGRDYTATDVTQIADPGMSDMGDDAGN